MTIKKLLAVVTVAAGAWPAGANAQGHVDPPAGDNYAAPITISSFDDPPPLPADFAFDADTSAYTLQDDMYKPPSEGGPREPRQCGESKYSKTIWTVFHADRKGVMTIQAKGDFDAVIGIVPFGNPNTDVTPDLDAGRCIDQSASHSETLRASVGRDKWYAVQVGGTGKRRGGPVALHFHFALPAPTLRMGLDVVRGSTSAAGVKLKKLLVKRLKRNGELLGPSPRGASVAVRCTRGCRSKTLELKGNALRLSYLEDKLLPAGTKFSVRITRANPRARGPQWTVSVDAKRRIHVSRPKYVGG